MKKRLNSYQGMLSAEEIAAGMSAASENSYRLLKDAELLLNAGSFPTAASIAALAIEEAGKCSILRRLATAKSENEALDVWRDYRKHTKKNAHWHLPELFIKGARKLNDFLPLFSEKSEHPYLLDQLKQLGFYTDCLGNRHWSKPTDVVSRELAEEIVRIAKILAGSGRQTQLREIELWSIHLGPVWGASVEEMQLGLVRWYSAMQMEGLYPEGENRIEKFISEGVAGAPHNSFKQTPNGAT